MTEAIFQIFVSKTLRSFGCWNRWGFYHKKDTCFNFCRTKLICIICVCLCLAIFFKIMLSYFCSDVDAGKQFDWDSLYHVFWVSATSLSNTSPPPSPLGPGRHSIYCPEAASVLLNMARMVCCKVSIVAVSWGNGLLHHCSLLQCSILAILFTSQASFALGFCWMWVESDPCVFFLAGLAELSRRLVAFGVSCYSCPVLDISLSQRGSILSGLVQSGFHRAFGCCGFPWSKTNTNYVKGWFVT